MEASEKTDKLESPGLTEAEARRNQAKFGWNELGKGKRTGFALRVVKKIVNPLILILVFSSILSVFLGEHTDAMIIGVILFVSLFLDAYQEQQAEGAAAELAKRIVPECLVRRDGKEKKIPTREVTIGDIIIISAGTVIPADALVLESDGLSLDEAAITGESFPREKKAGDRILMGTHVTSGFGQAQADAIGKGTEFGRIHQSVDRDKPATEFQRGLNDFSYLLIKATIVMSVILFFSKAVLGHELIMSLMFILALAIGFAPEMLPMILTINLSKGALRLAKSGVIVKFLPAIENFGSMDVLCTDKTGTLTEGRIDLAAFLGKDGQEDASVLEYARLNSRFQSGYRNPMDDAIVKKAGKQTAGFRKVGEVAYDFERRRLSVILEKDGRILMVTKGAVASVLSVCKNGKRAITYSGNLNREGLRTIGVAIKEVERKDEYKAADEREMEFAGLLAFSDPVKKDAARIMKRLAGSGVALKILTGDSPSVAKSVCEQVGIDATRMLAQDELEKMTDRKLSKSIDGISVFAGIDPESKLRIINALKAKGHVVGYLGDGINDAPSLKNADVGISVSNAVDVARESADLILLRKDLGVLRIGIEEGRKTFANIMKYILMGTSSTFGNMISLSLASLILPFLPMLPVQVLLNDLLYDLSQLLLVKDKVDRKLVKGPYRWDIGFIRKFMVVFGSASSIFDLLFFVILYKALRASSGMFQSGWFLESALSQMFIIFSIRTSIVPFYRSKVSRPFAFGVLAIAAFVLVLPFTPAAPWLHLVRLPPVFYLFLCAVILAYVVFTEFLKKAFYERIAAGRPHPASE